MADSLPLELVVLILDKLDVLTDRLMASQTCHLWHAAYQHPRFRDAEFIMITREQQLEEIVSTTHCDRLFYNFGIKECDLNSKSTNFWVRFGPDIKSLSILNCDISPRKFIQIMSYCYNVRELRILNCRELFMGHFVKSNSEIQHLSKHLSNVKKLSLSWNRYLTDAIFSYFIAVTEDIEYLNLSGCSITFHPGLYRKFYPHNEYLTSPSESVLTFRVIADGIAKKSKSLKNLDFTDTLIDSQAVGQLVQCETLNLNSLILRSCQQLSKEGISKICCFQKNLTELDVSMSSRISDVSLKDIAANLVHLKVLSLQKCKAITDLGIADIKHLTLLEKLNISECEQIIGEGLITALGNEIRQNMFELRMAGLGNITEQTIVTVSSCLPSLKHLDISYCVNAVTDYTIQRIIVSNRQLRVLLCGLCILISDSGLVGVSSPALNLTEQPLRLHLGSRAELQVINDAKHKKQVKEMSEAETCLIDSIKNLRNLRELVFTGCMRITDTSLTHAFHYVSLTSLDLSHCSQITHVGLADLARNNPSIETLNLDNCANVNDQGVHDLVTHLRRLKTFILGSPKITNLSVGYIVEFCRNLQYLDIRHCTSITNSAPGINILLQTLENFHFKVQ